MISGDLCLVARAVFDWAVAAQRLAYREYNALMREVARREKLIYGCRGKYGFDTFQHAQAVADRPCRDGHVHRKVFRCEACGKFHLSTLDRHYRQTDLALKRRRERSFA